MSSLYTIQSDLLDLIEGEGYQSFVDEETGEFDEQGFQNAIQQLQISKDAKLENCALAIKNLNAEINDIENEINSFKERKDKKKRKIESIKKIIDFALQGEKFETSKVSLYYTKSSKVEIYDENKVDEEYIKKTITTSFDKKAIREAIKKGVEVKGAEIITSSNLQIK